MGQKAYDQLAQYYRDEELTHGRATARKPWPTFTEDIKALADTVLVSHYTADNMAKQGRRRIDTPVGRVLACGDAARGSLHLDTYYGAIDRGEGVRYVVRRPLASLTAKDVKNIVDDTVRAIVEQAIADGGEKALQGTVWMNEQKRIPINKVRCYAPSITRPINIRQQRDQSSKEYKRQYHVANDRNYLMAIYVGHDARGKEKREFAIVNMLQAAAHFRTSAGQDNGEIVPATSPKGYPIAYRLRIGTMALLYENSPEELWQADEKELARRLYKVTGMSSMVVGGNPYGRIVLTHHQEARPSSEVKITNGKFKAADELRSAMMLLHTQLSALVCGVDFTLNELGHITFLRP